MMKRSIFTWLPVLLVVCSLSAEAQFSTGVNTSSPNKKAALDVVAPTGPAAQGVLVPRLFSSDSLYLADGPKNTEGLLYYDVNVHQFRYFNGTRWTCMLASPYQNALAGWNMIGNATTDGAFIGTLNAKPLVFKTNNAEAMTIAPNGRVTIGETNITSSAQLNVRGSINAEKAVTLTATGTANLVPIAYATTDGTGSFINTVSTPNLLILNRPDAGVYAYSITGEIISVTTHVVIATLINGNALRPSGEITWNARGGVVNIYTFDSGGLPQDRTFSFVVYRK